MKRSTTVWVMIITVFLSGTGIGILGHSLFVDSPPEVVIEYRDRVEYINQTVIEYINHTEYIYLNETEPMSNVTIPQFAAVSGTNNDLEDLSNFRNLGKYNGTLYWSVLDDTNEELIIKSAASLTGATTTEHTYDISQAQTQTFYSDVVLRIIYIGSKWYLLAAVMCIRSGTPNRQMIYCVFKNLSDDGAYSDLSTSVSASNPSSIFDIYTYGTKLQVLYWANYDTGDGNSYFGRASVTTAGTLTDDGYFKQAELSFWYGTTGGCMVDSDYIIYYQDNSDDIYRMTIPSTFSESVEKDSDLSLTPDTLFVQQYWKQPNGNIEILMDQDHLYTRVGGSNGTWQSRSETGTSTNAIIWDYDDDGNYKINYIVWKDMIYEVLPAGGLAPIQEFYDNAYVGWEDWFANGADIIYQRTLSSTRYGHSLQISEVLCKYTEGKAVVVDRTDDTPKVVDWDTWYDHGFGDGYDYKLEGTAQTAKTGVVQWGTSANPDLSDWDDNSTGALTEVIAEKFDHKNPIQHTYGGSGIDRDSYVFSAQTSGTIEFKCCSDSSQNYYIGDGVAGSSSALKIRVAIIDATNYRIYYGDGAGSVTFVSGSYSEFMHVKVTFDTDTDTFSCWVDGVSKVTDQPFYNDAVSDGFTQIQFASAGAGNAWIDAIGFSWDGYTAGDNQIGWNGEWQDASDPDCALTVEQEIDGRKNPLQLYDNNSSGRCSLARAFAAQEDGAIDLWVRGEDVTDLLEIVLYQSTTEAVRIKIDADKIQYYYSSSWNDATSGAVSDTTWYHFHLVFDTDTDTFDFYLNGFALDTGVAFATAVASGLDKIEIRTDDTDSGNKWWIDDLGFSWDGHIAYSTLRDLWAKGDFVSLYDVHNDELGFKGFIVDIVDLDRVDGVQLTLKAPWMIDLERKISYSISATAPDTYLPAIAAANFEYAQFDVASGGESDTIDYNEVALKGKLDKICKRNTWMWYVDDGTQTIYLDDGTERAIIDYKRGVPGVVQWGTAANPDLTEFTDNSGADCTVSVVAEVNEHKNVLQLDDQNGGERCLIDFSINETDGMIEFYIRGTDVTKGFYFYIESSSYFILRIQSEKLQYYQQSTTSYQDLANINDDTDYILTITFDCSTNQVDEILLNNISVGTNLAFRTTISTISTIQFATLLADSGYQYYLDGIGFSWDGYTAGRIRYPFAHSMGARLNKISPKRNRLSVSSAILTGGLQSDGTPAKGTYTDPDVDFGDVIRDAYPEETDETVLDAMAQNMVTQGNTTNLEVVFFVYRMSPIRWGRQIYFDFPKLRRKYPDLGIPQLYYVNKSEYQMVANLQKISLSSTLVFQYDKKLRRDNADVIEEETGGTNPDVNEQRIFGHATDGSHPDTIGDLSDVNNLPSDASKLLAGDGTWDDKYTDADAIAAVEGENPLDMNHNIRINGNDITEFTSDGGDSLKTFLGIGSSNGLWLDLPFGGFRDAENMDYYSGMVMNDGSNDSFFTYDIPLPYTRAGLNLVIDEIEIELYDADGNDYVNYVYLRYVDENGFTDVWSDSSKRTSPDTYTYTGVNSTLSGGKRYVVMVDATLTDANEFECAGVRVKYYYE